MGIGSFFWSVVARYFPDRDLVPWVLYGFSDEEESQDNYE